MTPVLPRIFELPGHIMIEVDLRKVLGNILTIYTAFNNRPTFYSNVPMRDIHYKMLGQAMGWEGLDELTNEKIPPLDAKERVRKMYDHIAGFFEALMRRMAYTQNYGQFIRDSLIGDKLVDLTYVSSPPVGWPRPYLKYPIAPIPPNGRNDELNTDCLRVPTLNSSFNLSIAKILLTLDIPRMSQDFIPASTAVAPHDSREQPFGTLLSLREQLRYVRKFYILYLLQGCTFVAHLHRRLIEKCIELSRPWDVRAENAIDSYETNWKYLLSFPLHPILRYIVNTFYTGDIMTYYGKHQVLWRFCPGFASTVDKGDQAQLGHGVMMRALVQEAINDYRDNLKTEGMPSPMWGVDEGIANQAEFRTLSMGQLARKIKSLSILSEGLDKIATQLHWTSPTGEIGTILQAAADFIACDGDMYSDPVGGAILG